ncbi:hypothetical protein D3C75_617230 [compost metagenome]
MKPSLPAKSSMLTSGGSTGGEPPSFKPFSGRFIAQVGAPIPCVLKPAVGSMICPVKSSCTRVCPPPPPSICTGGSLPAAVASKACVGSVPSAMACCMDATSCVSCSTLFTAFKPCSVQWLLRPRSSVLPSGKATLTAPLAPVTISSPL